MRRRRDERVHAIASRISRPVSDCSGTRPARPRNTASVKPRRRPAALQLTNRGAISSATVGRGASSTSTSTCVRFGSTRLAVHAGSTALYTVVSSHFHARPRVSSSPTAPLACAACAPCAKGSTREPACFGDEVEPAALGRQRRGPKARAAAATLASGCGPRARDLLPHLRCTARSPASNSSGGAAATSGLHAGGVQNARSAPVVTVSLLQAGHL